MNTKWIMSCAIVMMCGANFAEAKDLALKLLGDPAGKSVEQLSDAAQAAIEEFNEMGLGFDEVGLLGCFEAPLYDLATGRKVGMGVDCLKPMEAGDGLMVDATTFFLLPGGNLVNVGKTSVKPFVPGIGDADGAVTHITGSIPGPLPGGVMGTGRFSSWTGANARLSGAVNLSLDRGRIFFSCLFVIENPN